LAGRLEFQLATDILTTRQNNLVHKKAYVPESITRRLTKSICDDLYQTLNKLSDDEVIFVLSVVRALKYMETRESAQRVTRTLNDAARYLNQYYQNHFNVGDRISLATASNKQSTTSPISELFAQISESLAQISESLTQSNSRSKLYEEVQDLNPNRQEELVAISYYLNSELKTDEELKYVRKIMESYLKAIEHYRSPQTPKNERY